MYNVLSDKALLSEQVARSCQMCEISRSHQQLLQTTSENMNWAKAVLTASKRVHVAESGLEVDYIHEKASCEQQHGSHCQTHTMSTEYQSASLSGTQPCVLPCRLGLLSCYTRVS